MCFTTEELLDRANALAGRTIGELAAAHGREVPIDQRENKGFVGQLLELALGADAGNRDEPDFAALGIELKTLPTRRDGRPTESTFVCSIGLTELAEVEWAESRACRKLARVLFMPIEADRDTALALRRVGQPLDWRPSTEQHAQLRSDWEELTGILATGGADRVTAHLGKYLQVRPKAAHAGIRRRALADDGAFQWVNPRGFYLRRSFTQSVLAAATCMIEERPRRF